MGMGEETEQQRSESVTTKERRGGVRRVEGSRMMLVCETLMSYIGPKARLSYFMLT